MFQILWRFAEYLIIKTGHKFILEYISVYNSTNTMLLQTWTGPFNSFLDCVSFMYLMYAHCVIIYMDICMYLSRFLQLQMFIITSNTSKVKAGLT